MVCKLAFAALALLCVAQVLGGPAVHTPKQPLVKASKVNRNILEDIQKAVVAVEDVVAAANGLLAQVDSTLNVLTVDLVAQVKDILAKLGSFGIAKEAIDEIVAQVNIAVANVEAIVSGLVANIQEVITLVKQVLDNLENPFALIKYVTALVESASNLQKNLTTVVDRVTAECVALQNAILDLVRGLVGEVANEVIGALDAIYDTLTGEYNAVMRSYNSLIASVDAAVLAIQKVISNFGLRV